MELAEAYNRLFGEDESIATREALELFRANQDIDALDNEQQSNITETAIQLYGAFQEDRALHIEGRKDPNLKALLSELIEAEPPEADVQKGIPETVAAKPQTEVERDEGRVPYTRAVNPANLKDMLAAAQAGGKKKTAMADHDTNTPTPEPEKPVPSVPLAIVVPPVVRNLNVPVWVQRLHADEYYQMARKKTEEAFAESRDSDPSTRSRGYVHFAGWKRRASEQSQGCSGSEFIPHGNLLLKCAYDLQNGADPKSTDYIRFYVGP